MRNHAPAGILYAQAAIFFIVNEECASKRGWRVYGLFTPRHLFSTPFLHTTAHTSAHSLLELLMDVVFIAAIAALWGLMVLLVVGLKKLE